VTRVTAGRPSPRRPDLRRRLARAPLPRPVALRAERLAVPFQLVEELLRPVARPGSAGVPSSAIACCTTGTGNNDGMLTMPSSASIIRSCIAARTPPNAPAE
jgi:hypothetical protein